MVSKRLVPRDSVIPERLGDTWVAQIPSGPETCKLKSVKSATPTQHPGERRMNYIQHIQSQSRACRMHFMELMQKWENNDIEEIIVYLKPHKNPTGHMHIFLDAPSSAHLFLGTRVHSYISHPVVRKRPLNEINAKSEIMYFIFRILLCADMNREVKDSINYNQYHQVYSFNKNCKRLKK